MIRRVYIDNYKCFQNSEVDLSRFNLIMGRNGVGKTEFFNVLTKVKQLIIEEAKLDTVFPTRSLTRWQDRPVQTIELTLSGNQGLYSYELEVEHDIKNNQIRIKKEILFFDKKPLFEFRMGKVQLYRDDHSKGPEYPFDWGRSGLATIMPRHDNEKLTWFKDRLRRTYLLRLYPPSMEAESKEEEQTPSPGFENFTSWYRHASQENPQRQLELFDDLKASLVGFESLKLSSSGTKARVMEAAFSHSESGGSTLSTYTFDELSDGQRALVALYSIMRFTLRDDTTLCIDEPGNYLGLDEIKPWLLELEEASENEGTQVLLTSHHPRLIDSLALEKGILFTRAHAGPVRTKPVQAEEVGSITISDLMARGWLDE